MANKAEVEKFIPVVSLVKAYADEIGMEKALAVLTKWSLELMKAGFQKVMSEKGITVKDIKSLYLVNKFFEEEMGWGAEHWDFKETEDSITWKVKNCPVPEACAAVSFPADKFCQAITASLSEIDAFINPDLKWTGKFEPEEGCPNEITMRV